MDVDLLEDRRTDIDEAVWSVRLHDDDVARLYLLDHVSDYKTRLTILHNHDLVVFMTMQSCTMPGMRLDEEDGNRDVSLVCPDEIV